MTGPERRLDELVAAVTPRVVDEALQQAVGEARDELAHRFARAIVDRALASPPEDAPAARGPTPDEPGRVEGSATPVERDGTGLYAFAITPAHPVDLVRGVAGIDGEAPLFIIQGDDLGLVVSRMRLDLMDDVCEDDLSETGALATLARRHDEVIRSVFEHGPVLPLRFGTVVADEDAARRLLEDHATAARERLAHLDTHREWGVRLSRDAAAVDQDDDDRAARREMTGTSYLASRREALQRSQGEERQAAALTARVEQALSEHAVDVARRGGGPGSGLLADLAYLVPDVAEDAFVDAAEGLRGEAAADRLVLELTGPWPPYSFASMPSGDTAQGVVGGA